MKTHIYFALAISIFIFSTFGSSGAAVIDYSGRITGVWAPYGQPYADVGDNFSIQVDFDPWDMEPASIIVDLENWGTMLPPVHDAVYGYFYSSNDWLYCNTTTLWKMKDDVFSIESDGFPAIITGEIIPTPEPASFALLVFGMAGLIGWLARRRNPFMIW